MKKWMILAAAILVVLGIGFAVKGASDRKPTVQPSETALPEATAEPEQAAYVRLAAGYQTVTVTGTDGYVYIQKTIPFEAGGRFTIAVINRPGGLDLLRITDNCCFTSLQAAHFRVGNLARNSGALDVLLPDGRAVYSDVRFKEIASFKRIAPGAYEFLFAETNQLPAPAYSDIETLDSVFIGANPLPDTAASVYLQVTRGRAYTVYLLQNGQSYNAVSPLVVEDVIG